MKEKRCSKCKEIFPRTSEYFYINPKGIASGMCRTCGREYQRERDRNKAKGKNLNSPGKPRTAEIHHEGTQECSICEKEFPLTSEYFSVNKSYKTGLSKRCRNCQNAYYREKYAKRRAKRDNKKHVPKSEYQELIEERNKRDEEAYRKLVTEPRDKGIGDKLDTIKLSKDKKYRVERRKNEKNQYEFDFEGIMVQDTKDLVILRNKKGYCSTYRKADILCGDYKIKEA